MTTTDTARTVRPTTLAEARETMLAAGGTLLFRGGGTKLDWGLDPPAVDTVVETSGLDRVLAHDAGDATVSVQAGVSLAHLQAQLAADRQWLAIDPPSVASGATVGGVLAANDAGPRRLRYGTMRDLVIGCTVVLADGSVGRSGGKVIKNVAGYDLAKLLCGSLGTLGLIAEVTLRLHPLPAAGATVRVATGAEDAGRLTLSLMASAVEPHALDWTDRDPTESLGGDGRAGSLWVRLQGHPDAVGAQVDAVRRLASGHGETSVLSGDEDDAVWERLTASLAGADGETVARAASLPSRLAEVEHALRVAAGAADVDASLTSHAALGLHAARFRGGDAAAHAAAVTSWRGSVTALGGHVVIRRRLPGVERHTDVWGPPPAGIGLMRRVKQEFDPGRRCAPGRFVGGI